MDSGTVTKDVIRVHADPSQIDASAWDGLLARQAQPTPFMRHAYLAALHHSGSARPKSGWAPRFITVERDGVLVGALPAYLKSHSYGEYVFDWAWADAYRRHGLAYYPKLLAAVPFTPVPGSRLLAADDAVRRTLLAALIALARQESASSAHLLFPDAHEASLLSAEDSGYMPRQAVQFHWCRDDTDPPRDFADLLSRMRRDKRKKIQQEQRRVADAGVHFTVHAGQSITPALWDYFYTCYTLTYAAHHSTPYLSRAFFAAMAEHLAEHWLMFVARRGDAPVAVSLIAVDAASGQAWGRYWGCTERLDCLHFDACYYQPLAWVLANGYRRFEGGAQGEHKMARGLLPVGTHSGHWLAHPQFAAAVDDFLRAESRGIAEYVDELREHTPFKA